MIKVIYKNININMKKIILTLSIIFLSILSYGQLLEYPQKIDSNNQIIVHKAYVLSYNETCEQANWVKYMVTKIELASDDAKRKNNFKEDELITTGSASLDDYKGSGYDRGHLAPAASFVNDQEEMDESFYMSNISPQEPSFNRGIWKRLENYERELANQHDTIYVITGGVLNGDLQTIGDNEVCVPKLYFKIIYNKDFVMCFIINNKKSNDPLNMYKHPMKLVEKISGLKFKLN